MRAQLRPRDTAMKPMGRLRGDCEVVRREISMMKKRRAWT
jgi:hypothetical protein